MTHLEQLIAEFYDWKGYLVKQNIKVGPLLARQAGGLRDELVELAPFHAASPGHPTCVRPQP